MAKKAVGPLVKNRPAGRAAGMRTPQWLAQAAADAPRAMLCGREYLVVEGCRQVAEFSPERIELVTAQGAMRIEGGGLVISRECAHTAVVQGRIDRLCLGDADA